MRIYGSFCSISFWHSSFFILKSISNFCVVVFFCLLSVFVCVCWDYLIVCMYVYECVCCWIVSRFASGLRWTDKRLLCVKQSLEAKSGNAYRNTVERRQQQVFSIVKQCKRLLLVLLLLLLLLFSLSLSRAMSIFILLFQPYYWDPHCLLLMCDHTFTLSHSVSQT